MDSIPGILLGLSDSTARSSVNSPHEFCSFYRNDLSFQTKRLFSSDAHQVLSDILTREYEEELENEASSGALPPDLESLKKALEVDWKIVTDGAMTKLYRTLSSTSPPSKVQVSFHCQDTVAVVSELDEVEYGGSETEDYEEEAGTYERLERFFSLIMFEGPHSLMVSCTVFQSPYVLLLQ